jgi:hypothetical protein
VTKVVVSSSDTSDQPKTLRAGVAKACILLPKFFSLL